MQRRTIFFSGRVQGVGFRAAARAAASRRDVTGYVRNLSDGRVEMILEGEPAQVAAALDDLRSRMAGFIRDESVTVDPASGEFDAFEVRH